MKILIEGYNKSIHKRDNQLLIMEKDEELERINIKKIDDITIVGKGTISFDALRLISDNNVRFMSVDYFGKINYMLEYPEYENVFLRKQQYRYSDNYKGLILAREIIRSKMINQRSTIRTLNKSKKLQSIKGYESNIGQSISQLERMRFGENISVEKAKERIMGIEGSASVDYWLAVSQLLPEDICFFGRDKHHPTDIVNAMLNYAYAILASEVTKYLVINGLDPYCGFLHFDRQGRYSLSFDLIEEFRQQLVDKVIFSLVNTKQVSNEDFDKRNYSLSLEIRKLIISRVLDKIHSNLSFEDENMTYAEIIDRQAKKIVDYLVSGERYTGFSLRW